MTFKNVPYYQCMLCRFIQPSLTCCINCGSELMSHIYIINKDGLMIVEANNARVLTRDKILNKEY